MNVGKTTAYKSIKSKKIEWLWKPYIPFGKITIIEGDPGDGKTSFVLFLISQLSREKSELISGLSANSINIIYQSGEDDLQDTIKPKLEKYGGDTSKIFFIEKDDAISLDTKEIESYIKEKNIRMVVLDPIQSFIGDKNINNLSSMRKTLKNIGDIAKKTNCAIILIGHTNKSDGDKDLYRGLGSIDIIAAARSVLYLKRVDSSSSIRIIKQIKNNLAMEGEPIGFQFAKNGKIEYLGKIKLEEYSSEETNMSKRDLAKKILITSLESGDARANDILLKGMKYKISRRTFDSVRKEIGCRSIKKKDGWYWSLFDGDNNG